MVNKEKQFLVLEASAGSGKTYALALRYVYLLLQGAKIGEILSLTFTNKAVDEMKERIARFLRILAGANNAEQQGLLESLHNEYGLDAKEVRAKAPQILKEFLRQKVRISTIDSFLNAVIKKFCWYAGVPFGFEIAPLDVEALGARFLQKLNPKQKNDFLFLCLSHNYSIDQTLEHLHQIAIDYLDALPNITKPIAEDLYAQQIAELVQQIQRDIEANPKSSDTARKALHYQKIEDLVSKTAVQKGTEYRSFKSLGLNEADFDALHRLLKGYLKWKSESYLYEIKEFCDLFQQSRKELICSLGVLDFADITSKAYELLCKQNAHFDDFKDFFYFRLDDKISHILLDEFQDTSVIQYKLLAPLIDEIVSGVGRIGERSFFAVGDQKQSIYRFRGGYGRLMRMIVKNGIQRESLQSNYRSCGEVVAFVNAVFAEPYGDLYVPQKTEKSGGYVKIEKPLAKADKAEGLESIFGAVLEKIDTLHSCGVGFEEIAVLVFTNAEVANLGSFIKEKRPEIRVVLEEQVSLAEKWEAKIIINALKCSLAKHDPKTFEFYRDCLCKLLGHKIGEEIEIIPFEQIAEFVFLVIKTYKLGTFVAQKVLEIACESADEMEFLEKMKSASCQEIQEEQEGLKILTIHKSKGLEFDHLIVLDRTRQARSSGGMFCDYDDSLEGHIYLRTSHREVFDSEYASVLQRQKELESLEKINLLYVALTRAKTSLWILPTQQGKEFERIGLVAGDEVLVQQEWGEFGIERSTKPKVSAKEFYPLKQEGFGKQEGFIRYEQIAYQPNEIEAIKRGEAFHSALELALGYGAKQEEILDFLSNRYGAFLAIEKLETIPLIVEKVCQKIQSSFAYCRLESEVAFLLENKIYRMDCVLFLQDQNQKLEEIVVLDYKSGRKQGYYDEQIKQYTFYIQKQYPQIKTSGYLVYLDQQFEMVRVV
ncbi:RecB-like helicase [Helicobacter enhydrae]|uniref:RecB-like helicase n=1 Tax=Helicobacter enhydrae TaxID=222136 RepID=UPI001F36E6D2|nr:RecB-like helicase [Helicobacter enhydrae]